MSNAYKVLQDSEAIKSSSLILVNLKKLSSYLKV